MKIALIILLAVFLVAGVLGILVVIGAGKLCKQPVNFTDYKSNESRKGMQLKNEK